MSLFRQVVHWRVWPVRSLLRPRSRQDALTLVRLSLKTPARYQELDGKPYSLVGRDVSKVSTTGVPRAAPGYTVSLPRRVTRIHQVVAARDEGSLVGGEEGYEVGYLFRGAQAPQGMKHGDLRLSLRGKVFLE